MIDATQLRELALRESEGLASTADEAADTFEATDGPGVDIAEIERFPWHAVILTMTPHLGLIRQCFIADTRDDPPVVMHLGCIDAGTEAAGGAPSKASGGAPSKVAGGAPSKVAGATMARPATAAAGVMHPSVITFGTSSRPRTEIAGAAA